MVIKTCIYVDGKGFVFKEFPVKSVLIKTCRQTFLSQLYCASLLFEISADVITLVDLT